MVRYKINPLDPTGISPVEDKVIATSGGGGSSGPSTSISVVGDPKLTGDVTLSEGTNIALTQTGNNIEIASVGGGDVVGPASATDNSLARYDGTTGKLIQSSSVKVYDDGQLGGPTSIQMNNGLGTTIDFGVMYYDASTGVWHLGEQGYDLIDHKVGEEEFMRVVNKTGTNLTKAAYKVVYVDGAQGQRPKVALARADSDTTSSRTIGMVKETIPKNQEGYITVSGIIDGINTTGSLQSETWADGDVLWLSATTAGNVTTTKPAAPQHTVLVGYVIHAHATQGKIYVHIQNGYELEELHDVAISSVADKQVLTYESATSLWKNKSVATALGYTPEDVANKDTTATLGTSDTKYPSQKAVKTYVDTGLATKEPTLTKGNLTEATSSVLTISGGTGSVIGSGTTVQVKQASGSQAGYLSSTDWTTFNNKQAALGYTAEDVANKSTTTTLGTSNTLYPTQNAVKTYVDTQDALKVTGNAAITGATKTKITYDSKGLVTAGADAGIADITGLQTALDNKLDDSQLDTDGTLTANSDSKIASQKATKTYVDGLATSQGLVRNETPSGTINGTNTTFTLASTPSANSLRLYKNGVRLKSGAGNDYTLSGTTITMASAPATGTVLLADYELYTSGLNVGSNSLISDEVPTGSVNGTNKVFTTARAYVGATLEVFINGVKQRRTADFVETTPASGTFTMDEAPLTGDVIFVNYSYNLNPSSNADTVDGFHASDLMPVGAVLPYAGINTPSGNWLFAFGQAVSRSTYADLFAALGTTYGTGDGSTTFNLPDMRGRVPAGQDDMGGTSANRLTGLSGGVDGDVLGGTGGAQTHTLTASELPKIPVKVSGSTTAGYAGLLRNNANDGSATGYVNDVSYDGAHNNVQPTIVLNYIIKAL